MTNIRISKTVSFLKENLSNKRSLIISFLLAGLITTAFHLREKTQASQPKEIQSQSFDTFIPNGYTLVPIEVQNYESLDSIFGNFGVVSLFAPLTENSKSPKLLAERVKMLRAPLNPSQFGVLIKESEAGLIAGHSGPLFVIVHNRSTKTQGLALKKPIKKSRFQIVEEE